MPGWYIHLNVARKGIAALSANATASAIYSEPGLNAATLTSIAQSEPAYVALGAIGPDIFFMLPDFKPPIGNMLWRLATAVRELYTWWDDHFLGPFDSQMGPVERAGHDELNALLGDLPDTLNRIFSEANSYLQDTILKLILQQYDFFGLLSSGVSSGFDEQTLFWSDMLHYRETYRFGAALWQRASAEPDTTLRERFQAFALGWMSHLATDVTGHAFVNQKAGGPYRLHWQRHHLVENHMDAQVYNTDHGMQPIYNQMSNSALHLWMAFNPDGSSRVDFFRPEPNPAYPDGDHSADITLRNRAWDFDSNLPDELAQFISDTLKAVYTPALQAPDTGMVACCPTIISTLDARVPILGNGVPEKEDIIGAYCWLYKFLKWTTTDYYKIRRPEPPDLFVTPSIPLPPGSGDADPGPGVSATHSIEENVLDFLLALFAWAAYLGEICAWPAATIAGIVAGTATYLPREAIYESMELPLYNLWLAVHTYLAMTGYVMPMAGEVSSGLNTLGRSVADNWAVTVNALSEFNGGITPATFTTALSGNPSTGYPKDVLLDSPSNISSIFGTIFRPGGIEVHGEFPSEFTKPWLWPDAANNELPQNAPGPFSIGADATALFGSAPGTARARARFEAATTESDTIRTAIDLLPAGEHLGDPQDYTAYVIARLTRDGLNLDEVPNFNLDADRGYGYLCWDWLRDSARKSSPSAFVDQPDPSLAAGAFSPASRHEYPSPIQPGYGWNPSDEFQHTASNPSPQSFDPGDANASVRIRYIDKESKFII